MKPSSPYLLLTLIVCYGGNAHANSAHCPTTNSLSAALPSTTPDDPAVTRASAGKMLGGADRVILQDNVDLERQGERLSADNIELNRTTGEMIANGNVFYRTRELELRGQEVTTDQANGTFQIGEAEYGINTGPFIAQGRAKAISRDGKQKVHLDDATYSICPPEDEDWRIEAGSVTLNQELGIGTATNIVVDFMDVPIFYSPWFSFPIGRVRKTGLLMPSLGENRNTGIEFYQPFYWNIAPQADATFTLRNMSKRGNQLQSELRYLTRVGTWQINGENMSSDERFNNEARSFTRLNHAGNYGNGWTTSIDASSVSDSDYFDDLGDSLKLASISHLERRADLAYSNDHLRFQARAQRYQTVDSNIAAADRPYQRLPQLTFDGRAANHPYGLSFSLRSELVHFDREDSVVGNRFDIRPRLTLPLSRTAWFLKPSLSMWYTAYDLDDRTDGKSESITREVPVFSVDAGLFFDRYLDNSDDTISLEPRMFYLNVPYRDQSDIPLFDTAKLDFSFSQLFRENRFSGTDRVGDTEQLTLAMTSRYIEGATGRERLRGSIGQIFYKNDRQVTLNNDETVETDTSSDIAAEIAGQLDDHWSLRSSMQWGPNNDATQLGSTSFSYRNDQKLFNLAHRYQRDKHDQIDISFRWPINSQWTTLGRWNYSLDEEKDLETVIGIEYDSCCWAFRAAGRRYITDDGNDTTNTFFMQLILKELAPVGRDVGSIFERGILGYTDDYK